jgi:hypothetical protein
MCYKVLLRKYDLLEPRVRRELELVHGPRLGPSLMLFHVQLMLRSWLTDQISSDTHMHLPDFCTGLRTLEQNNNLSWVPSCANVPQLQDLLHVARPVGGAQQTHRIGAGSGGSSSSGVTIGGGSGAARAGGHTSGATTSAHLPATRARARNPARKRELNGSTPLTVNVRSRRIAEAIALAGELPTINREGGTKLTYVSWHANGMFFYDCDRDHAVQTDAEANEFMGWCQLAFT